MKNLFPFSLLLLFAAFFTSCNNNDVDSKTHDCVFEQDDSTTDGIIDATEQALMQECIDNALTEISAIQSALIGEWELVGYATGWIISNSQPCGHITFTQDELTIDFENNNIDTLLTLSYEISGGITGIPFIDAHGEYFEPLSILNFSEELMFVDGTPFDGNMYLYQKQN